MNTKLWKLYNLIKERTELKLNTSVSDICLALPEYYYLIERDGNYSNCPTLYEDIDEINASADTDKIIVKDNNNFKLGTEEDVKKYLDKLEIHALKQLKKYWNVKRKIMVNNQYKLLSNRLQPIDEHSKAREYVESYLTYEIESEIEKLPFTEQEAYWRKRYLDLGGYPIRLTLEQYKSEVKRLENNQSNQ